MFNIILQFLHLWQNCQTLPAESDGRPGERRHAEHGEGVPRAVAGGRAQDAGVRLWPCDIVELLPVNNLA